MLNDANNVKQLFFVNETIVGGGNTLEEIVILHIIINIRETTKDNERRVIKICFAFNILPYGNKEFSMNIFFFFIVLCDMKNNNI